MIDSWLVKHASPASVSPNTGNGSPEKDTTSVIARTGSGTATPVRKISAHEFERGGLLKPMVTNTSDGTPTFLTDEIASVFKSSGSKSRSDFQFLDEKELIFELVSFIIHSKLFTNFF